MYDHWTHFEVKKMNLYGHFGPLRGNNPFFFKIFLTHQSSRYRYKWHFLRIIFNFNPLNRHHFILSIFSIQGLKNKKRPFKGKIAQGCQAGANRILNLHPSREKLRMISRPTIGLILHSSKISNLKKKRWGTPNPRILNFSS